MRMMNREMIAAKETKKCGWLRTDMISDNDISDSTIVLQRRHKFVKMKFPKSLDCSAVPI
jgi:hypothetical protein